MKLNWNRVPDWLRVVAVLSLVGADSACERDRSKQLDSSRMKELAEN